MHTKGMKDGVMFINVKRSPFWEDETVEVSDLDMLLWDFIIPEEYDKVVSSGSTWPGTDHIDEKMFELYVNDEFKHKDEFMLSDVDDGDDVAIRYVGYFHNNVVLTSRTSLYIEDCVGKLDQGRVTYLARGLTDEEEYAILRAIAELNDSSLYDVVYANIPTYNDPSYGYFARWSSVLLEGFEWNTLNSKMLAGFGESLRSFVRNDPLSDFMYTPDIFEDRHGRKYRFVSHHEDWSRIYVDDPQMYLTDEEREAYATCWASQLSHGKEFRTLDTFALTYFKPALRYFIKKEHPSAFKYTVNDVLVGSRKFRFVIHRKNPDHAYAEETPSYY